MDVCTFLVEKGAAVDAEDKVCDYISMHSVLSIFVRFNVFHGWPVKEAGGRRCEEGETKVEQKRWEVELRHASSLRTALHRIAPLG